MTGELNQILEALTEAYKSVDEPYMKASTSLKLHNAIQVCKRLQNDKWISVYDERPNYYSLKLCKNKDGKIALCWRASDGDNEFYTIAQTDLIFEDVCFWKDVNYN